MCTGGSKFTAGHRLFATNRSDQFKTGDNSIEEAQQPFAALRGFLDQPFRFEHQQRRQPSRLARSFFENVDPWTTAQTMELKTLSKTLLWVSAAPTGTRPRGPPKATQQLVSNEFDNGQPCAVAH